MNTDLITHLRRVLDLLLQYSGEDRDAAIATCIDLLGECSESDGGLIAQDAAARIRKQVEVNIEMLAEHRARMKRAYAGGGAMTLPYTLCWHCSESHPITDDCCPRCGATNANVDPDRAMAECSGKVEIREPALLRVQAH